MKNLRVILPSALLVLSLSAVSLSSIPSPSDEINPKILLQASHALHAIADKATPAVVSITSIKSSRPRTTSPDTQPNTPPNTPSETPDQALLGIGSGVIVRPDGTILTNGHVISNAESVTVTIDEKHKSPAHVIGIDLKTDLAVIRLDTPPKSNLPTLPFGDSDLIQVGDWTLAIGSPFGLNRSVTSGIISAVGRARLGMLDIEDFIQTDAAINPGNSGGPLLNVKGEMIGINTAIFSQTGGFIGIGFAVPSKIAKQVLEELLAHGRVIRGWIGMMAQNLDPDLAQYFKVTTSQGALISQIIPHGPAAKAELQLGDVITKYGNNKVESAEQLKLLVAKTKTISQVPVEFFRNGTRNKLDILVTEQPGLKTINLAQQAGQSAMGKPHKSYLSLGLAVEDIPPEFSSLFGIPIDAGAIISDVQPGSPAFSAGLGIGDIILNLNKKEIKNAKDFLRTIKHDKNKSLNMLYIQRGPDEKIFVPVKVE